MERYVPGEWRLEELLARGAAAPVAPPAGDYLSAEEWAAAWGVARTTASSYIRRFVQEGTMGVARRAGVRCDGVGCQIPVYRVIPQEGQDGTR